MNTPALRDDEFEMFRHMIYEIAGINLSSAKKALVSGRLAKRIKHFSLASYADYFKMVKEDVHGELQTAIDLLTTNETFFFREPKHFDFLRDKILPEWRTGLRRVWSAASSSGEEAYTLAMVLAEHSPIPSWEIIGTDISSRVLERARRAQYPMGRSSDIPNNYLTKYCLKGIGSQAGTFIMGKELRARVSFMHANLKHNLTELGGFDLILLRNVMIYFDMETKRLVTSQLLRHLKPGGHLMIGHSESLNGITDEVKVVMPSIYRKI